MLMVGIDHPVYYFYFNPLVRGVDQGILTNYKYTQREFKLRFSALLKA